MIPLLVPPFVAVLMGAALAKQSASRYWRSATGSTLALSVAFFVSAAGRDGPHAVLTALILTGTLVTVPLLATFGLERVTATAPRWTAIGIGLLAYIPIVLITVTLSMQLGDILSPLLPGVMIPIP